MIILWIFFSVLLPLLQLWTAVAWIFGKTGSLQIEQAIVGGVVISWATTLSMKVAEDYNMFRRQRKKVSLYWRLRIFIRGVAVPAIVIWLATISYALLLDLKTLTKELVAYQVLLVALSSWHSSSHFLAAQAAVTSANVEGEEDHD
jgi:hypothetical protein